MSDETKNLLRFLTEALMDELVVLAYVLLFLNALRFWLWTREKAVPKEGGKG